MIVGIPKESKTEEYRVALTPAGAAELRKHGHTVVIEPGAGDGSGFSDREYLSAEAAVMEKEHIFTMAELVVKVKEPLPPEYDLLRENQALFTYLHLAPNRELTDLLLRKKIAAFAYETLEKNNTLPLLTPMSEIAGRMAPLMGAFFLQKVHKGAGVLPCGIEGVRPGKAVILGAGVVGFNAARLASGLGMDVIVLNRGIERLRTIDEIFMGRVKTLSLTPSNIQKEIEDADIVIGAVLVPGGRTPILITRGMLKSMKRGSVLVDVSIDQGGCAETSRPSTHDSPVYEVDGVIHYTVANMPAAFPRTSTLALTNATLPYILMIAEMGIEKAAIEPALRTALNTYQGKLTLPALQKNTPS
jgi:alanine dehydrogenase